MTVSISIRYASVRRSRIRPGASAAAGLVSLNGAVIDIAVSFRFVCRAESIEQGRGADHGPGPPSAVGRDTNRRQMGSSPPAYGGPSRWERPHVSARLGTSPK